MSELQVYRQEEDDREQARCEKQHHDHRHAYRGHAEEVDRQEGRGVLALMPYQPCE